MTKKHSNFTNNIHLIISVLVIIPAAFIYGFNPEVIVNITPETIDEFNLNKSIMGLYLGFSAVWLLGIFKSDFWKIAIVTNIIFMLGLGFGRIISFFNRRITFYPIRIRHCRRIAFRILWVMDFES